MNDVFSSKSQRVRKYCLIVFKWPILLLIGFLFFLIIFDDNSVADLKITKGDATAERDIEAAHKFVIDHMQAIFRGWDRIIGQVDTEQREQVFRNIGKYKDRFEEKFRNITIVVSDNRNMCVNDKWLGLAKYKGPRDRKQNKIWICLYDHAKTGNRCNLVNTIVHEAAHQYNVPGRTGHNSRPEGSADAVYLFGRVAGDICNARWSASDKAFESTRYNLANWSSCRMDDQCRSGACKTNDGSKVCVATERNDQPPSECAATPHLFENQYFRGRRIPVTENRYYLSASSWCVPSGWTVTVYKKSGMRGSGASIVGPRHGNFLGGKVKSVEVRRR